MEDDAFVSRALRTLEDIASPQSNTQRAYVSADLMERLVATLSQRPQASHCAWSMALTELRVMLKGQQKFNTPIVVSETLKRAALKEQEDRALVTHLVGSLSVHQVRIRDAGHPVVISALCRISGLETKPEQEFSQEVQADLKAHSRQDFIEISWVSECFLALLKALQDVNSLVPWTQSNDALRLTPAESLSFWREKLFNALHRWVEPQAVWPDQGMRDLMEEVEVEAEY